MNSEPLSLSSPRRGTGRRPRTSCRAALTRLWPLPQTGWSSTQPVAISTAHRVGKKKPLPSSPQWATRSTSRKAGLGLVPVGEGPQGDLLLEPAAGLRGTPPSARHRPAHGCPDPFQGRRADRAEVARGGRGDRQLATGHEAVEQGRQEWLEPLGPDLAGGFPQHLGYPGDVASVPPGSPDRALARAAPGHGAQRPQHGLAMIARHRHDLRHQATALAPAKALIALALSAEVLPHARPRHGGPLAGNRTSAIQPSRPVTIILRRRAFLTVTYELV